MTARVVVGYRESIRGTDFQGTRARHGFASQSFSVAVVPQSDGLPLAEARRCFQFIRGISIHAKRSDESGFVKSMVSDGIDEQGMQLRRSVWNGDEIGDEFDIPCRATAARHMRDFPNPCLRERSITKGLNGTPFADFVCKLRERLTLIGAVVKGDVSQDEREIHEQRPPPWAVAQGGHAEAQSAIQYARCPPFSFEAVGCLNQTEQVSIGVLGSRVHNATAEVDAGNTAERLQNLGRHNQATRFLVEVLTAAPEGKDFRMCGIGFQLADDVRGMPHQRDAPLAIIRRGQQFRGNGFIVESGGTARRRHEERACDENDKCVKKAHSRIARDDWTHGIQET